MLNDFIAYGAEGASKGAQYKSTIIMVAVWIAIFYFLIILPNKKKQKKQKALMESLKPGISVLTIGGIKGEVMSLTDDFVELKIDKGVRISLQKSAIKSVYNR